MSAEFSRRSFLKYTALTAAAVAGSSLLSGCSGEMNPVKQAVGTTNTVLQVRCTLNSAVYDAKAKTATYELEVYNGRGLGVLIHGSSLNITSTNFEVTGPNGYYAHMNDNISLRAKDSYDPQIRPNASETFIITAKNLSLSAGDEVKFRFFPDVPEYPEYSASWVLTMDAMTAQSSDTATSGS